MPKASPICHPVIVLEGPDGAGKSTLSNHLAKHFMWMQVHTGGPIVTRDEIFERIKTKELMTKEFAIFDRIPMISELVYPLVAPRELFITEQESLDLIKQMRPVIVYCRLDSSEKMLSHILSSPKGHKPPEYLEKVKANHQRITDRYEEVMKIIPPEFLIPFNWEQDFWLNVARKIVAKVY